MELIRPLVYSRDWDYGVVWKLGDDPSRFIEWMGCCCSGGAERMKVEEESDGGLRLCKDAYNQHLVKTTSCYKLAEFPSSIPLYSGVHGDVAISNQPKWLNHAKSSKSNFSLELSGTQVIIPVVGGLIELFTTRLVLKDQNLIEYITSSCTVNEVITVLSNKEKPQELQKLSASLCNKIFSPKLQNRSFEGSSSVSTLSNENPSFKSASQDASPTQSIEKPNFSARNASKKTSDLVLEYANGVIVNQCNMKFKPDKERKQYQSKNLVTERKRRNRIKDGLFTLRALVPIITKMDRAAILGDAIDYIEELKKTVKNYEGELREINEEDEHENNADAEVPEQKAMFESFKQVEVQKEVNQIGTRDFLLKLICNEKRGGVMRVMDVITSLGLQIIDANINTCHGKVLIVLKVKSEKEIEVKDLEDDLSNSKF